MSMFVCAACGGFADADDGCEEVAGKLVCSDCIEDQWHAQENAADGCIQMMEERNGIR